MPVTAAAWQLRKKPVSRTYTGTVINKINLNDHGSNKETWHIEIAAEGVEYQCGDSIGIVPENPTEVVEAIIAVSGADAGKIVQV